MVKTVVSNKEIVHLWGKQDYARSNSCSFKGNKFYSYNKEIGCLKDTSKGQVAIIDYSTYSVTTSKHQGNLHWAVNHLPTFSYSHSENSRWKNTLTPSQVTPNYLYNHYIEKATELQTKATRARKTDYKLLYIQQAKSYLTKANSVIDYFECNLKRLDENQFDSLLETLAAEAELARQKAEEIRLAKVALDLEYYKETFEKWLVGEKVNFPGSYHNKGIFLRVVEDKVETSRGATFPVSSCETIFKLYKRIIEKGEVYSTPISVGHYTISHISKKGIIAGCHHIKPEEITRFARVLGLK